MTTFGFMGNNSGGITIGGGGPLLGNSNSLLDDSSNSSTVSIKTPIPTELFKIVKDELSSIFAKISNDYKIPQDQLVSRYNEDISKMGIKLGMKRRNRRSLPKDLQCMGRKIDGGQCTRSRRNGEEFCLSHLKRLPHGRIDDPNFVNKEKGKRGRKKKEINYNDEEYLCVHLELIKGKQYLLDENDNVFSYNLESPVFLGKKGDMENND